MRKNKKEFSLLPHIKEEIYGLSPEYAQILGWEMTKFDIPSLWKHLFRIWVCTLEI